MKLILNRKLRYQVTNKEGVIEYHFTTRYLSLGYKDSSRFISIWEEDTAELFLYAKSIWNTSF